MTTSPTRNPTRNPARKRDDDKAAWLLLLLLGGGILIATRKQPPQNGGAPSTVTKRATVATSIMSIEPTAAPAPSPVVVGVAETPEGLARGRGLVYFDLAGTVPSGYRVTEAYLRLHGRFIEQVVGGEPPFGGPNIAGRAIDVHNVAKPWVAGEVTWTLASASEAWDNPGGDMGSAYATKTFAASDLGVTDEVDVTNLIDWSMPFANLLVKFTSETISGPASGPNVLIIAWGPSPPPELVITMAPA